MLPCRVTSLFYLTCDVGSKFIFLCVVFLSVKYSQCEYLPVCLATYFVSSSLSQLYFDIQAKAELSAHSAEHNLFRSGQNTNKPYHLSNMMEAV